jgi:hypothetical protein
MNERGFWQLGHVSDEDLVQGLADLVARGAWTDVRIVAHLAELDGRGARLREGKSLFVYCKERLGLSGNEAYFRIVAARMARKYPIVFELLGQRRVHLTALALIRHYVSDENHRALLEAIAGKTKEQILRLLATRAPRPDAVNRIRRVPITETSVGAGPTATFEPLSATAYRLELHMKQTLKDKLELAADLMSHSNPTRDLSVLVERAMDLLIERLKKQRFGLTEKPRPAGARGKESGLPVTAKVQTTAKAQATAKVQATAKSDATAKAQATAKVQATSKAQAQA